MKKILLFASALTGLAVAAQAQEATTVKTTTVQYQVPTCTNCRTTTQVRTTYPDPKPVCDTCQAQPVVAKPVVMKKKEQKRLELTCHDNHELGIRNPLFVLKEGQFSIQQADGVFKEPKGRKGEKPAGAGQTWGENRGYNAYGQVAYGVTDKLTLQLFGGHNYAAPKTKQYRASRAEAGLPTGPIPHSNGYDGTLGAYYHVLDLCHLDAIIGFEGGAHRQKTKTGDDVRRTDSWNVGWSATVGANFGWFTPYVSGSYKWGRHQIVVNQSTGKKKWERDHGFWVNPGIYIQPSKWYAFDFNVSKKEHNQAEWNAGIDVYPYKNVVFGGQLKARRPLHNPMDMYGISGVAKVVF